MGFVRRNLKTRIAQLCALRPRIAILIDAAPPCRRGSAFRQNDFLSTDGAIQRVDQHLNLDELVACPLGLVPVKRSGQHLRMHVPFLDHARTGFLQRFKSLAHSGSMTFQWTNWRCSSGSQLFIACISAEILMVAKLEKVSDTAYGRMMWSLCCIAPQV